MNLVFSDEQEEYRRQVRNFAARVLRPLAEQQFDFTTPLSRDDIGALRRAIEVHEVAMSAPVRPDGTLDRICLGVFVEEVSRVNICLALLGNALFFPLWNIRDLLDEQQAKIYAHVFAPGEIVSMGLSEPNVGSDPSQIETRARRTDTGWVINGRKQWTSYATISAGILTACRKADEDGGGISLFLMDRTTQEYDVRVIPCLGMSAISTCEVTFEECWVPPEAELTPDRDGLRAALALVEQARFDIVFQAIGVAQAALDLAVSYAKDRAQFGRPIGSFQLIQEMLADMGTQIEAARLLAYRACSLVEAGEPARAEISMAKAYATEMGVRVASAAIQVHGAIGLTTECAAERYLRDARMLTIPDGTTQIHKLVIGRELTGLSAFR
jgi:acyl-CoA dehydrogenase